MCVVYVHVCIYICVELNVQFRINFLDGIKLQGIRGSQSRGNPYMNAIHWTALLEYFTNLRAHSVSSLEQKHMLISTPGFIYNGFARILI